MSVTRLAPSPTGALHLGNARTFLVNWLLARQLGWKIILRIEDLDGPRVKKGADQEAIEDLRWLGIDWDEGPIYQSARMERYAGAAENLLRIGAAYPCVCSRSEIESAASAPHAEDGAAVYPGTCQGKFASVAEAKEKTGRAPAIRFGVSGGEMLSRKRPPPRPSPGVPGEGVVVEFADRFLGQQKFQMSGLGDFVIAKGDGTAAYQLAVVIDDAEMGVTKIVRGDDLLDSTPRQIMLYRALGYADLIPDYFHLPLVVGEDDRRLAKRHGDTRLSYYREQGVSAGRVLELLGRWCGINGLRVKSAGDFLGRFDLEKLPRERIIFTTRDDVWLKGDGK